jgi:hypothetical protein
VKAPAGLGVRGSELWAALSEGRTFDAAWGVLAAEACRAADRLEKLDELLRGEVGAWASIEFDGAQRRYVVVFDDALAEARQQASALRQLVSQLKLGASVTAPRVVEERSALDDLESRRRARRSPAAG